MVVAGDSSLLEDGCQWLLQVIALWRKPKALRLAASRLQSAANRKAENDGPT